MFSAEGAALCFWQSCCSCLYLNIRWTRPMVTPSLSNHCLHLLPLQLSQETQPDTSLNKREQKPTIRAGKPALEWVSFQGTRLKLGTCKCCLHVSPTNVSCFAATWNSLGASKLKGCLFLENDQSNRQTTTIPEHKPYCMSSDHQLIFWITSYKICPY